MARGSIVLLMVVALASPAGGAEALRIVDVAGDANGGFDEVGPTEPASYDRGDLLVVTLASTYTSRRVGADGIDHEATGIRARFGTTRPLTETTFTIAVRLAFRVGECNSSIDVYLHGPVPGSVMGPADRSVEWWQNGEGCPGEAVYPNWSVTTDVATDDLVLTAPYAQMMPEQRAHLAPGVTATNVRAVTTFFVGNDIGGDRTRGWFPWIDFARSAADWEIGADIPADVPCTSGC